MSLIIKCSELLQKHLAESIHQQEEHANPIFDIWHATEITIKTKNILIFTHQVSDFCLLMEIQKKVSPQGLIALFKNNLAEQIKENQSLHAYQHFFNKKIKHGVSLALGAEANIHWLSSEIKKLLEENADLLKDLIRTSHMINNTKFPELQFHTPAQKLELTLANLPKDEK